MCDYILCEDTRHTSLLLKHYSIQKPLKSFHKFNESFREDQVIEDLKMGKEIALVSDAGTPGISDPGSQLVQRCIDEGVTVSAIPGACAAITALSCSGLDTDVFQFLGFLPRKKGELQKALQGILSYSGTTILYESPHRFLELLKIIMDYDPERKIVIARELTKKFEEIQRGTVQEIVNKWKDKVVKGEIVILIAPKTKTGEDWTNFSPEEHVAWLEETYHLNHKEAIKMAAEMRGVSKREIYNATDVK